VEQRFKAVLNKLSGNKKWPHTILAVSGGIDSVVMAYLYQDCGMPYTLAHCNFQLRGDDSMRDEEFVVALAKKGGVKVLVERFETEKRASEKGVSIQMAARDLRYKWFAQLAKDFKAKIAIAHHANDVAETMLFNLAKGTGMAGLHGIAENDGIIIRPLLWAKKEEIVGFAQKTGIAWREDHSNESEKYMRNIIRKKVIPELERVNPSFITTNLRNASRIREAEKFIQYSIEQLGLIEDRDGHIYINKNALLNLKGSQAVLYQLIRSYGFSYDQVRSIIRSSDRPGAIFVADKWVLNIDRKYLLISNNEHNLTERWVRKEDDIIEFESFSLRTEIMEMVAYNIIPDNQVAALDLDKLTFPLFIRTWRNGDYFSPLGMQGKKKVSDFIIDEKIPLNLKRQILVLVSDEDIAWVIGYRINDNFKITPQTRRVYQLKKVTN
jgi:tRNA(Ile)-lysidine synthase